MARLLIFLVVVWLRTGCGMSEPVFHPAPVPRTTPRTASLAVDGTCTDTAGYDGVAVVLSSSGSTPWGESDPGKLSTICKFTSGPAAGTTRDLAPQPPLPIGSRCTDGAGSYGVVIAPTPGAKAAPAIPRPAAPARPEAPRVGAAPHARVKTRSAPVPAKSPIVSTPASGSSTAPPPPPPQSSPANPVTPQTVPNDTGKAAESPLQQHVAEWFASLMQGGIQYKIPATMYWKMTSTVTAVIQGPQAPPSTGLPEPTGTGSLKVSDRMKVLLSSPDNPDEFTITDENGSSDIQFVPANSSTTWTWSVTPRYTGKKQTLQITAWALYPGHSDEILEQLPVYTATIDVHVPGFGESLKRLVEGDPDYWLKYGLPGGGGFVFVAGIVVAVRKWIRVRRRRRHAARVAAGR